MDAPPGYMRAFAKVDTLPEALTVASALCAAVAADAVVSQCQVQAYYKEEGWFEIALDFSRLDYPALSARLAEVWTPSGDGGVWNPEAHWNQGEGARFAVPGIVWANLETLPPETAED